MTPPLSPYRYKKHLSPLRVKAAMFFRDIGYWLAYLSVYFEKRRRSLKSYINMASQILKGP